MTKMWLISPRGFNHIFVINGVPGRFAKAWAAAVAGEKPAYGRLLLPSILVIQEVGAGRRRGRVELLLQPTVAYVHAQEAGHSIRNEGWISVERCHEARPSVFLVVLRRADWAGSPLTRVCVLHPAGVRTVSEVSHGALQGSRQGVP